MELHIDDIKDFLFHELIELGFAPSDEEIHVLANLFGDLLMDLGVAEAGSEDYED